MRSIAPAGISSLLKLCKNPSHIHQIHAYTLRLALDHDNLLLSNLISAASSLNCCSDYTHSLFNHKSQPDDIYLFNNAIKTLTLHNHPHKAIQLYNGIQKAGLRPDSYSFPFVLKAAGQVEVVWAGEQVHGQVIRIGFGAGVHVGVALVRCYSVCGRVGAARKVFDEMRVRDVALWNAMVAGYVGCGEMGKAREVFEGMKERNVISWTTMVCGYVDVNEPGQAVGVFRSMQVAGVVPDEVALLAGLSACADLGAVELGEWIHNYIDRHSLCRMVPLTNGLIDMYVKSGNITKAFEIFKKMERRSVITWTTMIAGLAHHGLGRQALDLFFDMENAGVMPNDITFIAILSACSHVGLVEQSRLYFTTMSSKYGIRPKIEHYGCMVDLLGRAGLLKEAEDMIMKMPFQANAAIWGSLLASARVHGDAELAMRALGHLSRLEPNHSGNYSLASNTYAALGRWNEARNVRKLMKDSGVKKLTGGSSIEVDSVIHGFAAGDKSHPEERKVYEALQEINSCSKMLYHDHQIVEYEGIIG